MGIVRQHQLDLSAQRAAMAASGGNQPLSTTPTVEAHDLPLKLLVRRAFLSAGGARPTPVEQERIMGTNDLVDEFFFDRALLAGMPVCRILIRGQDGRSLGSGTGFMVSPRLLLTNEHVLRSAEEAAPSLAEFNYRMNVAGDPEPTYRFHLRPDLYFFNNVEFDFALVAVEPKSVDGATPLSRFGYHRLMPTSGKAVKGEWLTIVQHPGGAPRQWAIRENECMEDSLADVLLYRSDTAPGSSGAAVLNDSFQVVALHHSGVPKKDASGRPMLRDGSSVDSLDGIEDSLVDWAANEGIRVSSICAHIDQAAPENQGYLAELVASREGGDILSTAFHASRRSEEVTLQPASVAPASASTPVYASVTGGGRLELGTLVLELGEPFAGLAARLGLGTQRNLAGNVAADMTDVSVATETYKEPIIDIDYSTRTGFDLNFLGLDTPLPEVNDPSLIAPTKSGDSIIPYEHFSVVLHRKRKLAIFTASNVDGRTQVIQPQPGHDYTRAGLTGLLKKGEMEKWVLDPRVDECFQIPDRFYTKDNGAFDKGHIVRREDVCWGKTFEQIQRANGDTYHVTNCSPQRGNFNQTGKSGIWGQLENFIGSQADSERYCIFAGPVLSDDDEVFSGTERVQIPSRFWKVVCAVKDGKLQVFAFVLEQDLSTLPKEFVITPVWKARQKSLAQIEKLIGLVSFAQLYHDADQI
ncbi:DNA/RNA non-specific endonuclease [Pseudomonas sp. KB_15]|uniref:DNA/RNA non-specific endonuclease n=1 Tax=Pseudomonas sp. KB_15 TaxID=3233035 RepID=UPI003F958357